MSEFKEIKTQEEFDLAIKERLERERAKFSDYDDLKKQNKDYIDKIAELNGTIKTNGEKYADYEKTLGELNSKIKSYETASVKTRIALETGLPYEMASRLTGEDEESIKKDAAALSKLIKPIQTAPVANLDEAYYSKTNSKTALKELLAGIKEQNN